MKIERKFKTGDLVEVTDICIKEKVAFTAGRPMDRPDLPVYTYFEKDKIYKVKEMGIYGDGDCLNIRVLVEGSTQFVHQDNFIPAKLTEHEKYAIKTLNLNYQDIYINRKINSLEKEANEESKIYEGITKNEYHNLDGDKIVYLKYRGTADPVKRLEEAAKYYASKELGPNSGYSMFIDYNMDNPWELILIEKS